MHTDASITRSSQGISRRGDASSLYRDSVSTDFQNGPSDYGSLTAHNDALRTSDYRETTFLTRPPSPHLCIAAKKSITRRTELAKLAAILANAKSLTEGGQEDKSGTSKRHYVELSRWRIPWDSETREPRLSLSVRYYFRGLLGRQRIHPLLPFVHIAFPLRTRNRCGESLKSTKPPHSLPRAL